MTDNQAPNRADFARAAALLVHHIRADADGVNEIIRLAEEANRLAALLLAIVDTAIAEPGNSIGTPQGVKDLGRFAMDMRTADEAPDDDQRAHGKDFQRGAMFYRYRLRRNRDGLNAILTEADNAGRLSALIIAAAHLACLAPGSKLATVGGLARLERVALTMNQPETEDGEG